MRRISSIRRTHSPEAVLRRARNRVRGYRRPGAASRPLTHMGSLSGAHGAGAGRQAGRVGRSRCRTGSSLRLEDGETVTARKVVLAVGITHFDYMSRESGRSAGAVSVAQLRAIAKWSRSADAASSSSAAALPLSTWRDCCTKLAPMCRSSVARPELKFHSQPDRQAALVVAEDPASAIGAWARDAFALLCQRSLELFTICPRVSAWKSSQRALGPSGGWFIKNKVVGKVPLLLGFDIARRRNSGRQCSSESSSARRQRRETCEPST